MAYATYADLMAAIVDDLARSDLYPKIKRATADFESTFNMTARVADMEVAAALAPSNGVVTLPNDFIELRDVVATYGYLSGYYISGSALILPSTGSSTVTVLYYARLPSLVNDTDANWLLAKFPKLYRYGILTEMTEWLPQDKAGEYQSRYDRAFEEMRSADNSKRWNGMAATMREPTP